MKFLIILVLFLPYEALAESSSGLPVKFIAVQILNFSVFLSLLFYLTQKKAGVFLKKNKAEFLAEQAAAARLQEEAHKALKKQQSALKELQAKDLKQAVQAALDRQSLVLKKEFQKTSEVLKQGTDRIFEQQKFKKLQQIKTQLWSRLLQDTQQKCQAMPAGQKARINQQFIAQLENR